jgi:TolB-like protein/cytochrome c-type biogenesis protein CcmH/NrfG
MNIRRIVGATAGLLLGSGCATVQPTPQVAIARLEAQRTAAPKSVEVLRALGIQYYKAQRYAEARTTLTEAASLAPNDGVAALYLGMSAEAMNDLPAAKAAYSSYLKVGRTRRVRRQLEGRLANMQRRELQAAAKTAVAQEATISATPGDKNTVAVMPFRFTGADSSLRPLERGFADLLATDLSRVKALTVVERSRLQAILDEIQLARTGAVDSTTAVRAGKLIQAGTLVQGSLLQNGDKLRTDAALVSVATSTLSPSGAADEQNLDRLFDMEKRIALALVATLGVPITTAERNAIEQRPTKSLQAFLAYSQGLAYEDQGRFDDASRAYANAARIDPGFGVAQQKSVATANMSMGSGNIASLEAGLQGTTEGSVVSAASQGSATSAGQSGGSAQNAAESLNPSTTSAATGGSTTGGAAPPVTDPSAGTGADNPAKSKVVITIKPPRE